MVTDLPLASIVTHTVISGNMLLEQVIIHEQLHKSAEDVGCEI